MSAKHHAQAVEPSPLMDYRAVGDDAWYTVRLRLEDDKLRILYCNFSEAFDELHSVEAFADLESIEKFRGRFRPTSSQLQDRNCDVVVKGMQVCASYLFAEDDLRFYDAIVESVNPSIHPLDEGQCRCKFELLWQHGPLNGKKTTLGIESLCIVTFQGIFFNLILETFLEIVKEKLMSKICQDSTLGFDSLNSTPEPENKGHGFSPATVSPCRSQMHNSTSIYKSKLPREDHCSSMHMRASEVDQTSKRASRKQTLRGKISTESIVDKEEEDADMGGESLTKYENFEKKRTFYFCRIENLEKDLSPFTVIHFVQENLGIQCSAFVCPSISHEFCTRGYILLEGNYQAQRLMDFLLNKEHYIVSLRGRPWVIDDTCCGITEGFMPYQVNPRSAREKQPAQIKFVHKGTDEYDKIKKIHSLHSKFLENVNFVLLGRLLADEKTLMKQLN